jgi:hypothetical protein
VGLHLYDEDDLVPARDHAYPRSVINTRRYRDLPPNGLVGEPLAQALRTGSAIDDARAIAACADRLARDLQRTHGAFERLIKGDLNRLF